MGLTTHLNAVTEEVASIRNKGYKTRLDARELRQMGMLEHERTGESEHDPESHRYSEGQQEDADTMNQRANMGFHAVEFGECLVHDDTDSIIQDALTENDRVEMGVDFVLREDGKDCDWVRRGECGSKDKTLKEC